jgi:RNA polymerase sigma factor (sigma-70 family)
MAREQSAAILDPLRRLITRQTGSALSDAQLLENFVTRQDEASFEVLVWRHGAMVLALCTRVLRDAHEAEDAFQATFLVFARKAGSIGRGEVVAAWLYKVAYRVALRLRSAAVKRAVQSEPTDALPAPEPVGNADWGELRPVLDDEIARLPEKYRVPFVLCYLEGRTNDEAAAQIGCPKGTVLSRLSRGRERLRARLARRGVAPSSTAFALALAHNAASASVPAALVPSTVGAAVPFAAGTVTPLVSAHTAALAEGVLKTMTLIKMKTTAALLALAVLGTGLAWGARGAGDSPAPAPVPAVATAAAPEVGAQPAPASNTAAAINEADERREEQREGQRERPAAPAANLSGRVSSVAKDGTSFVLETPPAERGAEPTKTTVKFADKATVTYHGVGPKGAKPTEGYTAQVWFDGNSKEMAVTVVFSAEHHGRRGPDVMGTVVNGKDNKSVTVEGRPQERGGAAPQATVPFDDKTVLIFSNVGKDEARITAGYHAGIWYADDGKTAAKVQFMGAADERRRDEKRPDSTGKVVKADGKSLVLETPPAERGGEPTKTTIILGDKSAMVFNNVPAGGAKVSEGMQAQVWLADGSKDTAARVAFVGTIPERWATVSGKVVSAVSTKAGTTVTVEQPATARGQEPKQTKVHLTEKTKIAFFGVGPDEAEITSGMILQARLLDGSADTAAEIVLSKPGGRGTNGRER